MCSAVRNLYIALLNNRGHIFETFRFDDRISVSLIVSGTYLTFAFAELYNTDKNWCSFTTGYSYDSVIKDRL